MAKAKTKKGQKAATASKKGAAKGAAAKSKQKVADKSQAGRKGKGGSPKGRAQRAQAVKQSKGSTRERRGAMQFLREVKVELSKVTWPNREELTQSTIVVFIAIAVAAAYIAIFDELFTRLIELIS